MRYRLIRASLLACCLFAIPSPALADDSEGGAAKTLDEDPRDGPLPAGPAILSVCSKNTSKPGETGLYMRSVGGGTTKLWSGDPYDACALPDRTTLVAERFKGRVLRLDANGKILFEKKGLVTPVDVELGYDGTLIVVLRDPGEVVGLDSLTGKLKWVRRGFTTPFDCFPLPDGGLVVADSGAGRVVELDAKGKIRLTIKNLGFPNTIERTPGGNTLVPTWTGGEILEFDKTGKQVWKANIAGTIYRAQRRKDGSTLVVEGEQGLIHILDPKGRTLRSEPFKPACVDYEPLPGL